MRMQLSTLLPLGEKGRDEGTAPPSAVFARTHHVDAACCVESDVTLPPSDSLEQPLTPFPLCPKGRGE